MQGNPLLFQSQALKRHSAVIRPSQHHEDAKIESADQLVEALERCPVSELVPLIPRLIEIVAKVQFSCSFPLLGSLSGEAEKNSHTDINFGWFLLTGDQTV
jgi:hypothetical protein